MAMSACWSSSLFFTSMVCVAERISLMPIGVSMLALSLKLVLGGVPAANVGCPTHFACAFSDCGEL
jgi:hypothetical protein